MADVFPLHNALEELDAWRQRAHPPEWQWLAVSRWVGGLMDAPWQWPSIPIPAESDLPLYETRHAEVPESGGIQVSYRHDFSPERSVILVIGPPFPE